MYKLTFLKRVYGFTYPGKKRKRIKAILIDGTKVKVEGFVEVPESRKRMDDDEIRSSYPKAKYIGIVKEIYAKTYEEAIGYFLSFSMKMELKDAKTKKDKSK